MRGICGLAIAIVLTATSCSRQTLTELQKVRSGMFDVVLLSPHDALRHGKDEFVIEFRSTSGGALVDVGDVRGTASMSMAGTPMLGTVDVKRTDVPGRYAGSSEFSMAGTWRMAFDWKGPAGAGSVTFPGTVQ